MTGVFNKLRNAADFFSIGSLTRTLFAPFRQISAHAGFLDRLISRCVGAVTRFFIIIFGIIAISVEAILGLLLVIVWPAIPLLPIGCVVLTMMGVA